MPNMSGAGMYLAIKKNQQKDIKIIFLTPMNKLDYDIIKSSEELAKAHI